MFSLKCGYESIFDVDKYKLEGKVIHPNSILKSYTTLSEEQFLNIYLSSKSGLLNVGSIRLDIVGGVEVNIKSAIDKCQDKNAYICYTLKLEQENS